MKKNPPPIVQKLKHIKHLSDRRNYKEKHRQLRDLIKKHPHDFYIDSEAHGIVGVTHSKTNFRVHIPLRELKVHLPRHHKSVLHGIKA